MEQELNALFEKALEQDQFQVYLQPKVRLVDQTVGGAEALVRWFHPQRGRIGPGDFIPLFERNGNICKLDLYMFEQVCRLIHRWMNEGRPLIPISVNLSRAHFKNLNFLRDFSELKERYCIPDAVSYTHLHTIEDVGICLGQALGQALGDKRGIVRFATFTVPMDEALCMASVDISGRPYLAFVADLPPAYLLGNFEVETAEDFFRALCFAAGITLHVREIVGSNAHHVLEAMFKAVARALDGASQMDARVEGVPSTKGVL